MPQTGGDQKPQGDREAYRRAGDAEKKVPEGDFKPGFHGGYAAAGRGGPRGRGAPSA